MGQNNLEEIYAKLVDHFGPQGWWPGESTFEVMVGAVLTQNTNWNNVEKAIDNLKRAGLMSFEKMAAMPAGLLAEYIRPAGYFNVKSERLHNLIKTIRNEFDGDLQNMLSSDTDDLRKLLLSVKGIGPETADSILLYAFEKPVFVVDAYTYRILFRHELIPEDFGYDELQQLFMENIEEDVSLYNEFHALLVCVGKEYCKKSAPRCQACPLENV